MDDLAIPEPDQRPGYHSHQRWYGWDGWDEHEDPKPVLVVIRCLPYAGFGTNRYGCEVYYGLGAKGDEARRRALSD